MSAESPKFNSPIMSGKDDELPTDIPELKRQVGFSKCVEVDEDLTVPKELFKPRKAKTSRAIHQFVWDRLPISDNQKATILAAMLKEL